MKAYYLIDAVILLQCCSFEIAEKRGKMIVPDTLVTHGQIVTHNDG